MPLYIFTNKTIYKLASINHKKTSLNYYEKDETRKFSLFAIWPTRPKKNIIKMFDPKLETKKRTLRERREERNRKSQSKKGGIK